MAKLPPVLTDAEIGATPPAPTKPPVLTDSEIGFKPPVLTDEEIGAESSALEAFGWGAGQSALLGFLDEFRGGLDAAEEMKVSPLTAVLPSKAIEAFGMMTPEELTRYKTLYTKYRDAHRVAEELAREEHPAAYGAGVVAGVLPQLAIPIGAAGTAAKAGAGILSQAGRAAAIEAGIGAIAGAGEAREVEDIPEMAAKYGAMGGVFAGVAVPAVKVLGKAGGYVQREMGERLVPYIRETSEKLEEKVSQALASDQAGERALREAAIDTRTATKVGDVVEWRRQVSDDTIEMLNSKVDTEALVEPSWTDKVNRAHDVALANRVEFGRFVLGKDFRDASNGKILRELRDWVAQNGQEMASETWSNFRKYKKTNELRHSGLLRKIDEMNLGYIPPWIRRAAMFMSEGRYVGVAVDQRWGTNLSGVMERAGMGLDRSTLVRDVMLRDITSITKAVKSEADDLLTVTKHNYRAAGVVKTDEAPRLTLALEHEDFYKSLKPGEKALVDRMRDHFELIRQTAVGVGVPIEKRANYVPHMLKDTPDFIRSVKTKLKDNGLDYDRVADMTNSQVSKIVDSLDEVTRRELGMALKVVSGDIKTPASWRRAISQLQDIRIVHEKLTSSTAQAMRRGSESLPTFIREQDPFKLANKWGTSVFRHAYLRKPIMEARTLAKQLEELGDKNAADYINNWIADLMGTRVNTLAGNVKLMVTRTQIMLDDLADKADSPVEERFYRSLKEIPDLMSMASGVMYSNLLGFNPRVILRNLTQPLVMTAPELPSNYGLKLAFRAQFDVLPAYMRRDWVGTRAIEKLGLTEAGLTPGKFTEELRSVMESRLAESLPADLVKKYIKVAMWMYEKSDLHNRMVTYKMAQRIGRDVYEGTAAMAAKKALSRDQAAALRYISNLEPGVGREIKAILRRGADMDVSELNNTLSRHLISKTQFQYNRATMSEYGRTMGHLLSTFTKWPLAITGEIGSNFLRMDVDKAAIVSARKFLGPVVFLGVIDKFAMPDPKEDDRIRLLVGGSGLVGWTPVQSAVGFISGQFASPPLVDAAVEAVSITASGEPSKFAAWFERSTKYWTPGVSFMKLLFDDIPTLQSGENPKTVDHWLRNLTE